MPFLRRILHLLKCPFLIRTSIYHTSKKLFAIMFASVPSGVFQNSPCGLSQIKSILELGLFMATKYTTIDILLINISCDQ